MKHKKHNCLKSILVWLLLAAMMLPSCSEQTADPESESEVETVAPAAVSEETEIAEETEREYLDDLPETYDMNGREFHFYLADVDHITLGNRSIVVAEDTTGDLVNDAVFRRNERLNQRFNATITLMQEAQDKLVTTIRSIVSSGSADYDVSVGYQAYAIAASAEGLLFDLADSEYLNFDADYWATELIDNMSYKGQIYWGTGDITMKYLGGVSVTYVNERLKTDYLPDADLYDDVDSGTWTMDKLYGYTADTYIDLNEDGKADIEDQYGFMLTCEDPMDAAVVGAGIAYTTYDENNIPAITIDAERMTSFFEKMSQLLKDNTNAFICPGDDNKTYMTTFAQGNTLFAINKLYMTEFYFRDMEDDYLILPLPKLDENQENYRSATHDGVAIYGIPVTAQGTEETEMLLEAMAADSKKIVTPAYLDGALKNKYSRDADTARMVDLVLSNTFSDFAMQYHRSVGMISHFYREIFSGNNDSIASALASKEKSWNKTLERLLASFEENIEG